VWGLSAWIGSEWCKERPRVRRQLPHLSHAGKGVHRKLPHLSHAGKGVHRREQELRNYFAALKARLRRVRICCGDWSRVLGPSPTVHVGVTGVLLDPPYGADTGRDPEIYASEDVSVAVSVREWAIEHGGEPRLRIALCGYEGEHGMPGDWECVPWKATGGYAAAVGNTENARRERIWFSPHCLKATLF
jgi:hypothetical protein